MAPQLDFSSFVKLEELSLCDSSCMTDDTDNCVYRNLPSLRQLKLHGTPVWSFNWYNFSNLTALEVLRCHFGAVREVEAILLCTNLRELDLFHCRRLHHLPDEISRLKSLEVRHTVK